MTHIDTCLPAYGALIPFLGLLTMIATGPVLYPKFWHHYYRYIAVGLCLLVVGYYVVGLGNYEKPIEALAEYVQFIMLISALYMASSGILIKFNTVVTPAKNLGILWVGAVLANVIGTTGASMLLIRPYIRLNRKNIQPYHIVFFIFMVSNVGGALTPIGDPPLFLGFLKGVPFFWTLWYGFFPWCLALSLISVGFYWMDGRASSSEDVEKGGESSIEVEGTTSLVLLAVVVGSVFIDPSTLAWVPSISYGHHQFSFVRELIFLGVAVYAYFKTDRKILEENEFSLEPLQEVIFVFIGIFGTMMPALQLIGHFAQSEAGQKLINPHSLYWATGVLSSVLDNAPTYLNFLAAGMAAHGLQIEHVQEVAIYLQEHPMLLRATSLAAVFFGAMTYVGNGPNFMVAAIAESQGIKMPSFGKYIGKYALPFLFPVLFIVWVVFFIVM